MVGECLYGFNKHREDGQMKNIEHFQENLAGAEAFRMNLKRPFITISYAQSLNGSIALSTKEQVHLSGPESLILTHRLRSLCDAILVGIETVLSDNPRLTVRLVEGKNPQPIILDTCIRIPLDAKLVQRSDLSSWIVSAQTSTKVKVDRLQRAGATIIPCATAEDGKIDLFALMNLLADMQINSVMVEGGAKVITSFIDARLVDQFVITIAPKLLGGLQVIENSRLTGSHCLKLRHVEYEYLGKDLILWACPVWEQT